MQVDMLFEVSNKFADVFDYLQQEHGIDIVKEIQDEVKDMWFEPEGFLEQITSSEFDKGKCDGSFEAVQEWYGLRAKIAGMLGISVKERDLNDVLSLRNQGICDKCGNENRCVVDHFVNGERVASLCTICHEEAINASEGKATVDVTIQVPVALWKEYKAFCETVEHELPADIIERTAIDGIHSSIQNAIAEGRYTNRIIAMLRERGKVSITWPEN